MERYISTLHPANPAPRARPPAELDFPLLPDLAWLPPTLFILLQNPLSGDPAAYGSQIILRLGRILSATTPAEQRIPVRRALQALAAQLPPDAFATRCVRPVQRYLDQIAASGRLGSAKVEVMMAGVLLDVLRQANEAGGGKVPYSEFYNKVGFRRVVFWGGLQDGFSRSGVVVEVVHPAMHGKCLVPGSSAFTPRHASLRRCMLFITGASLVMHKPPSTQTRVRIYIILTSYLHLNNPLCARTLCVFT